MVLGPFHRQNNHHYHNHNHYFHHHNQLHCIANIVRWHHFTKAVHVRCIAMPLRYVHNFVSPPCDTKLVHDAMPQCHTKVVHKATQELSTIVVSRGSLSVVSLARAQICPSIPLIPSAVWYTPKSWHNEAKQTAFALFQSTLKSSTEYCHERGWEKCQLKKNMFVGREKN